MKFEIKQLLPKPLQIQDFEYGSIVTDKPVGGSAYIVLKCELGDCCVANLKTGGAYRVERGCLYYKLEVTTQPVFQQI